VSVDTTSGGNVQWEAFEHDDAANVVGLTGTLVTGVVHAWDVDVDAFNEVVQRTLASTDVVESFDRDLIDRAWTYGAQRGSTSRDESYSRWRCQSEH
jgi:hypothetical protein